MKSSFNNDEFIMQNYLASRPADLEVKPDDIPLDDSDFDLSPPVKKRRYEYIPSIYDLAFLCCV